MIQVRYVQPAEEEVCDTKGGEEGQVAIMIINEDSSSMRIIMIMIMRRMMIIVIINEDYHDHDHDDEENGGKQVTSLVANEGLIVCGLCNGTANVYSQVQYQMLTNISILLMSFRVVQD